MNAPPVAVVEILVLYRVLVRRLQAVAWVQSARFSGYNWVPVPIVIDTGALMNSAKFKLISWDHGRVGMNRRQRGGNLALIHEFGAPRKRIPARPFFTPAFEKTKPKIVELYKEAIKRAFSK